MKILSRSLGRIVERIIATHYSVIYTIWLRMTSKGYWTITNCKKTDRNPTGDDSKKWGHSKESIEKSNRISCHVHETTGPADMATRAQAANILMRFDQSVVEN